MDLTEDLDRLGDSGAKVASALRAKGVRGVPGMHACCPVAVYLCQLHPGHKFQVDNDRVQIDGEGRCPLPRSVRNFIKRFDFGAYPDLITRTVEDLGAAS